LRISFFVTINKNIHCVNLLNNITKINIIIMAVMRCFSDFK